MTGFGKSDECPIAQPSSSRRRAMRVEPQVRRLSRNERAVVNVLQELSEKVGESALAEHFVWNAPRSLREALREELRLLDEEQGGVE